MFFIWPLKSKIESPRRRNANFHSWVTRLPIEMNVHVANIFWRLLQIPAFCLLASKIRISNSSPLQGRRVNRLPCLLHTSSGPTFRKPCFGKHVVSPISGENHTGQDIQGPLCSVAFGEVVASVPLRPSVQPQRATWWQKVFLIPHVLHPANTILTRSVVAFTTSVERSRSSFAMPEVPTKNAGPKSFSRHVSIKCMVYITWYGHSLKGTNVLKSAVRILRRFPCGKAAGHKPKSQRCKTSSWWIQGHVSCWDLCSLAT